MAKDLEALKPCPFCGGEGVLSHLYGIAVRGWQVECENAMSGSGICYLEFPKFEDRGEAIIAWNTREALESK